MTFKLALWQPIAIVLSSLNLVAVGFAAGAAEPYHAAVHAALALGFGLVGPTPAAAPGPDAGRGRAGGPARGARSRRRRLRRELTETQERLDFAERVMAQPPESRRVEPGH